MFNNKTKFFLICSLLLITLVGISAISAADTDNTTSDTSQSSISDTSPVLSDQPATINNVDHNKIKEKQSVQTTQKSVKKTHKSLKQEGTSGNFAELNSTVNTATENVTLAKDYQKNNDEQPVIIDKTVTIDGKGHTITSNNGSFTITKGNTVTFKNIIFTGNLYKNSVITAEGNVTFDNVTFINNTVSGYVGAALETSSDTVIIMKNVTGIKNNGVYGSFNFGRSQVTVIDSSFYNSSTNNGVLTSSNRQVSITVINSTFENNIAVNYGGGINSRGKIYIYTSTFINNTANSKGGAVAGRGSYLEIQNSKFISNRVTGTGSSKQGGAIYIDCDALLANNTMSKNTAYNGSAIFQRSSDLSSVNVTVNNITVVEGANFDLTVFVTDDMNNSISGCDVTITFDNTNYTVDVVEGIATLPVTNDLNAGNYTVTAVYNNAVIENQTVVPGVVTIIESPELRYKTVQNQINNITAGSTITLPDNIKRRQAEDNITVNKTVTIDGNGNKINANQGHIFIVNNGATLTLKNMIIYNANGIEGAIANITKGKLILENVTIANNTVKNSGLNTAGNLILLAEDSTLTINNSAIYNNTAAIIKADGNTTINNTRIYNNTVPNDSNSQGWINLGGKLSIYNSVISNNTGRLAGIYGLTQKYPMIVDNSSFINNKATIGNGGAIQTHEDTTITNSTFIGNKVTNTIGRDGGAIMNYGGFLTIIQSTFINNTATGEGSIVDNYYGGGFNITNSVLIPSGTRSALYNEDETGSAVTANNNWWGTNTKPTSYIKSGQYYDDYEEDYLDCNPIVVNNWVIMNSTITPDSNISYLNNITIKTVFNKVTDATGAISTLEGGLPEGLTVTYTSDRDEFSSPTTTVENLETTNNYTLYQSTYLIKVTQANQTITLTGNVTMPEPKKIILTDDTYDQYFDSEGKLILSMVPPNSELQFSGTFKNRNMTISLPINMTTATDQAILNNCTITLTSEGQHTNITNIIMNNSNYSTELIYIDNTTDILIKNCTLTQFNNNGGTTAINLTNANNIKIISNNINVTGPSDNIYYDDNYVGHTITTSITGYNSSNNTIENNIIVTNVTGESEAFGTITGISFIGDPMNFDEDIESNYNTINNNTIITVSKAYGYGVSFNGKVNNNNITNNIIRTTSDQYANGVQLTGPASYNTISNNDINVQADDVTYGLYISTNTMGAVTYNTITYNNITGNSSSVYLMEIWSINYNNISYNKLSGSNNYVLGIGGYRSRYNNITYNNITVTGDMKNSPVENDNIQVENSGIKLIGSSNSNTIQFNNINVTTPDNSTNTINLTGSYSNTVTNNTLYSTLNIGSGSVLTESYNTVENNTPSNEVTLTSENVKTTALKPGVIVVTVTDSLGNPVNIGTVTFTMGNETVTADVVNSTAKANFTNAIGTYTVNIKYNGNTVFNENETNVTLTIEKVDTTVDLTGNLSLYQNNTITVTLKDADGNSINSSRVFVTIGDVTRVVTITDGVGTFTYQPTSMDDITFTTVYEGNEIYNNASNTNTISVTDDRYSSNIKLNYNNYVMLVNNNLNINGVFKVNNAKTNINGLVVTVDGESISLINIKNNGKFTYVYTPTTPGTHTIMISYAGNETCKPSNATLTIKTMALVTINSNIPRTVIINNTTDLTANITDEQGNPITGTITMKVNNRVINSLSDVSSINTKYVFDTLGDKVITITYTDPNGIYADNTKMVVLTVEPIPVTMKTTPINGVVREELPVTVTVVDAEDNNVNDGIVKFVTDNGTVLGYAQVDKGLATVKITPDASLNTKVEAKYLGTDTYNIAKATTTLVVSNEKTTTITTSNTTKTLKTTQDNKKTATVTVNKVSVKAGQKTKFTAPIKSNDGKTVNSGNVVFKINGVTLKDNAGKVISAKVVNGKATVNYKISASIKARNYVLTCIYNENFYGNTSDNATLTVKK